MAENRIFIEKKKKKKDDGRAKGLFFYSPANSSRGKVAHRPHSPKR